MLSEQRDHPLSRVRTRQFGVVVDVDDDIAVCVFETDVLRVCGTGPVGDVIELDPVGVESSAWSEQFDDGVGAVPDSDEFDGFVMLVSHRLDSVDEIVRSTVGSDNVRDERLGIVFERRPEGVLAGSALGHGLGWRSAHQHILPSKSSFRSPRTNGAGSSVTR